MVAQLPVYNPFHYVSISPTSLMLDKNGVLGHVDDLN